MTETWSNLANLGERYRAEMKKPAEPAPEAKIVEPVRYGEPLPAAVEPRR